MIWRDAVDPASFVTLEEFTEYLRRTVRQEDTFERKACEALNAAAASFRDYTGRELHTKVYREPISISEVSLLDPGSDDSVEVVTLDSNDGVFFGLVYPGDDVSGPVALSHQRVAAVRYSEVDLTHGWVGSKRPSGTHVFVFGSAPMYVSGDGSTSIRATEFPVTEVLSCAEWNGTTWDDVDVTDAVFATYELGRIVFPNHAFERGSRNVRLEVRAGYVEPGTSGPGHPADFQTLRSVTLTVATQAFMDETVLRSLAGGLQRGGPPAPAAFSDSAFPAIVLQRLEPYRRKA